MHLAGPLDGLAEAARTGHGPIGGVIVSRRDRSLCVEDLCDILVEVHAVAVQGSALHEGQGAGGICTGLLIMEWYFLLIISEKKLTNLATQ